MVMELKGREKCGVSYKWVDDEKEIVKKYFDGSKKNTENIQYYIKQKTGVYRTQHAIRNMAGKLNLSHNRYVKWDDNSKQRLLELSGKHTATQIANIMGRSAGSICREANELGIILGSRFEWYTLDDVVNILGRWKGTVKRWIYEKKLKAKKHTESPNSDWHIEEEDLRNFIIKYPAELTGRNIDLIQVVSILCPDEFKIKH